jgi:hypothetical protein
MDFSHLLRFKTKQNSYKRIKTTKHTKQHIKRNSNLSKLQNSVITYLLTELALLEEPLIGQPLKNFPALHGTRRFNTVFTRTLHCSLSWATSIQSTPSHPIPPRFISILSTHLHLGLPSGLFLAFPPISYKHSSSPQFVLHSPPISSFLTWSL